jgi:hypothetical protein
MDVPIVANVLGTLGAVFWSIQLIPQIVVNYRRHNATGLQPSMVRESFTTLSSHPSTNKADKETTDDALGVGRRAARNVHDR